MATNHPVFSFEQRMICGDIFKNLKNCELKTNSGAGHHHQQQQETDSLSNATPPPTSAGTPLGMAPSSAQTQPPQPGQSQQHPIASQPPQQQPIPMQIPLPPQQAVPPPNQQQVPLPIPGFSQAPIAQMMAGDHMTVDGLQQMQMQIPQDFTMPPPTTVPPHWALRNPVFQVGLDTSFPPPSSSPHLSNPSSPIHSRTASPTRIPTSSVQHRISRNQQPTPSEQQQQRQHHPQHTHPQDHRDQRESQQQAQQQQQPIKSVDESLLLDQTTALTQLQQLRNGFRPSHNTLPRQSNKQSYVNQIQYHHQQQQAHQQQQQSNFHGTNPGLGLAYPMNNLSLIDLTQKSSSDSGSSAGDMSPPETPGLNTTPSNNIGGLIRSRSSNLGRINGRPDKQQQLGSSVIYNQTVAQQQAAVQSQQQVQTQPQFVGGSNDIMQWK